MSKEYKIWNGLVINNSPIITGITNDSGLTNLSTVLPTSNAVKGYVDNSVNNKLNLSGGTLTGSLTGTSIYLSDTLYIGGLTIGTTNKIVYYDTVSKVLTYDDMGTSSQWTTSGTSIFYSGGSVTIGSNLQYNEMVIIRKDVPLGTGASLHLINHNAGIGNSNADTEIIFSTRLDSGGTTSRYRYSKIHSIGSGTFGQVGRLSLGMTDSGDNYQDILNIHSTHVSISNELYVSGMTNDSSPSNIVYYNTVDGKLTYGTLSSSSGSYSALTYNTINYGSIIQTPGTYTINFTTTDIFNVEISGNTTTDIIFDFSNEIVGKTVVMNIKNPYDNTSCIFDPTTCKTFGLYDPLKTNAISVLCVSSVNPKFWVAIANS